MIMAATVKRALHYLVFKGTVREGNYGTRVVAFLKKTIEDRGNKATVIDPEVLDLPLIKKPLHFYKDRSEAPQILHDVDKLIRECDGFVFVSAEYNLSLPPALTNTVDHFPPASFRHRPAGVVTYSAGRFAGVRAGVVIRSFLSEIGTLHIPATFTIAQVQNAFSEDGVPTEDRSKESATRMLNELDWYALAISEYREKHGTPEIPKL